MFQTTRRQPEGCSHLLKIQVTAPLGRQRLRGQCAELQCTAYALDQQPELGPGPSSGRGSPACQHTNDPLTAFLLPIPMMQGFNIRFKYFCLERRTLPSEDKTMVSSSWPFQKLGCVTSVSLQCCHTTTACGRKTGWNLAGPLGPLLAPRVVKGMEAAASGARA